MKFASHTIRLALQAEQILNEHDLDLERNSEILKSVRRGDWTLDQVKEWFKNKEADLNKLYTDSTLRYSPAFTEIKNLLLTCLESHYGDLSKFYNSASDLTIQRKYAQILKVINE